MIHKQFASSRIMCCHLSSFPCFTVSFLLL